MPRAILVAVILGWSAAAAFAQTPASSFAQLQTRLALGDSVIVTSEDGQVVKGKVLRLSESSLVLSRKGGDLTLPAGEVRRVALSSHAILGGAVIGLLAGATTGVAWAASQECRVACFSSPAGVAITGTLSGAAGLAVGAVIGAGVARPRVLFEREGQRPQAAIVPWFATGRRGLRLEVRW